MLLFNLKSLVSAPSLKSNFPTNPHFVCRSIIISQRFEEVTLPQLLSEHMFFSLEMLYYIFYKKKNLWILYWCLPSPRKLFLWLWYQNRIIGVFFNLAFHCLSIYLSISLSIFLFFHLSIYLSIFDIKLSMISVYNYIFCLSVYLSILNLYAYLRI